MNYWINVASPPDGILAVSPTYGWLTLLVFLIVSSGALWILSKPSVPPPRDDENEREYPDAA